MGLEVLVGMMGLTGEAWRQGESVWALEGGTPGSGLSIGGRLWFDS